MITPIIIFLRYFPMLFSCIYWMDIFTIKQTKLEMLDLISICFIAIFSLCDIVLYIFLMFEYK